MTSSTVGILLGQLGTPEAPTAKALRPFLKEFLGDPRVIEVNRALWWCVLNGIILPTRPARSAALYRRVWTERGPPLLFHTMAQAEGLRSALGGEVLVEVGMRYGNPSAEAALERLLAAGVDRILVFPQFPQYASATTGSVHDAVFDHFKKRRVIPGLRFVPPYPERPAYIQALATTIREGLGQLDWEPDKILLSFHGIPKRYVTRGDIYETHTVATAKALASALELQDDDWLLSYQSRFGREEWLKPYTDETLEELARSGTRRVVAACPGFTVDCLETVDEIGRESARVFKEAGGEAFHLIPCLNAHPAWIEGMAEIAREELAGWWNGAQSLDAQRQGGTIDRATRQS